MNTVTVEEWENIQGYEGLYQVSNYGRIKRLKNVRVGWVQDEYMVQQNVQDKSVTAILWKNTLPIEVQVGKLVASHFVPNPNDKKRIKYIDGNITHLGFKNLEWY